MAITLTLKQKYDDDENESILKLQFCPEVIEIQTNLFLSWDLFLHLKQDDYLNKWSIYYSNFKPIFPFRKRK